MPRRPTTSPDASIVGSARRQDPAELAVGPHESGTPPRTARPVGDRVLERGDDALPVVGMHDSTCASKVPSKSRGSTPWMRWNSSLHCTASVATSHSQRPTWASASPSRSRASASPSIACASRCSVMSCTTATDPDVRAAVQDGAQRQRTPPRGSRRGARSRCRGGRCGRRRPLRRTDVRSPATEDRGTARPTATPTISLEVVAEDARRGAVPRRDPVCGVDAEHRVTGRVDECVEDGEPHRDAARQFLRCWCLAPGRLRECHVTPSSPSWQRIARRRFRCPRHHRLVGTMTGGATRSRCRRRPRRRRTRPRPPLRRRARRMWCLAPAGRSTPATSRWSSCTR